MPIVNCKMCGSEFSVKLSHQMLGWGKYCSKNCKTNAQCNGKFFTCFCCKKEVYRSLSQIDHSKSGKMFCSKPCQTTWKNKLASADKHPNWMGGTQIYRKILLQSQAPIICTLCNINDLRILSAHHIDHNRKNNQLSNLSWLCQNCHMLVHCDKYVENKLKDKISKNGASSSVG